MRNVRKEGPMQASRDNLFFRNVAIRLLGSLDIQKAVERTAEYIQDFIPIDIMTLSYYEPTNRGIYRVAGLGNPPDYIHHPSAPVAIADVGWIDTIAERLKCLIADPVLISNRPSQDALHDLVKELAPEFEGFSCILMELSIEGQNIGSLWIARKGDCIYNSEHAKWLLSVRDLFAISLSNVRRYNQLHIEKLLADDSNQTLKSELKTYHREHLIGADLGLKWVAESVRQVSSLNTIVLITGETGVGKEEVARLIHETSDRKDEPFIKVNCAAIADTLIDSELFGHEQGAFTDAKRRHQGYFERAHRGSILLDEISELSLQLQTKLLRVIEKKAFFRLGGSIPVTPDFRMIASSNKNLEELVQQGLFRMDLYYRLNVFPIHVPPLRERPRDIPALVSHFIALLQNEFSICEIPSVDECDMRRLMRYHWPGNVRELRNVVERAMILRKNNRLNFNFGFDTGSPDWLSNTGSHPGMASLEQHEKAHILHVIDMSGGRIQGRGGAAEILDIHPNTLRSRMKKLGIPIKKPRSAAHRGGNMKRSHLPDTP